MPVKVPFLREEQIERDAEALLAEYERARGVRILPPVPIENIIEKHLKIGVEFDDLHAVLGVPRSGSESEADILGAVFFDDRRIVIDEGLDPEENPAKEGRYRFTLAHEGGGHWRLHRHLFEKDPAQRFVVQYAETAFGSVQVEPGKRTHRVASGLLRGVPADASSACFRRMA